MSLPNLAGAGWGDAPAAAGVAAGNIDEGYIYRRRNNRGTHMFFVQAGFQDGWAYGTADVSNLMRKVYEVILSDPSSLTTALAMATGHVNARQSKQQIARIDNETIHFYAGFRSQDVARRRMPATTFSVRLSLLHSMFYSGLIGNFEYGYKETGANVARDRVGGQIAASTAEGQMMLSQLNWAKWMGGVGDVVLMKAELVIGTCGLGRAWLSFCGFDGQSVEASRPSGKRRSRPPRGIGSLNWRGLALAHRLAGM